MSECGQAYPEYIAPCERNNRVKAMGTDHRRKRYIAQQHCIRISALHQILEQMCSGLSTRELALPVTCGHLMARTRKSQIGAKANRTMKTRKFRFYSASRETMSFQRKLLAKRMNSVTIHLGLSM